MEYLIDPQSGWNEARDSYNGGGTSAANGCTFGVGGTRGPGFNDLYIQINGVWRNRSFYRNNSSSSSSGGLLIGLPSSDFMSYHRSHGGQKSKILHWLNVIFTYPFSGFSWETVSVSNNVPHDGYIPANLFAKDGWLQLGKSLTYMEKYGQDMRIDDLIITKKNLVAGSGGSAYHHFEYSKHIKIDLNKTSNNAFYQYNGRMLYSPGSGNTYNVHLPNLKQENFPEVKQIRGKTDTFRYGVQIFGNMAREGQTDMDILRESSVGIIRFSNWELFVEFVKLILTEPEDHYNLKLEE